MGQIVIEKAPNRYTLNGHDMLISAIRLGITKSFINGGGFWLGIGTLPHYTHYWIDSSTHIHVHRDASRVFVHDAPPVPVAGSDSMDV